MYSDLESFILEYDLKERNVFKKEETNGFLKNAAKKYNVDITSERISKSIIRNNLIYNKSIIGSLFGVRPSSTPKEVIKLCRDLEGIKVLFEYLNLGVSEDREYPFFIRVNVVEGIFTSATLVMPQFIVGDGQSSIDLLIEQKNSVRKQSAYFKNKLLEYTDEIECNLKNAGFNKNTVLKKSEVFILNNVNSINDQSETLDITNNLSHDLIVKVVNMVASIPDVYTSAIDFTTDNFHSGKNLSFKSLTVSPNPRLSFLTDKGQNVNMYENLVMANLIKYKVNKGIDLTVVESSTNGKLNVFKNLKNKYMSEIEQADLSKIKFSNSFKNKLTLFMKNKQIESNKNDRDYLKNNVLINEDIFRKEETEKGLKITKSNVLRLLKSRSDSNSMAVKALDNEIIPFPGFESVIFDEHYYYTDKTKKYGASYQLYIQSLRIVAVLLQEYEKNENLLYLYKAEELIYSWISYVSKGTNEKMVWYDHPTANRAQILIQYLYLAQNANIDVDLNLFRSILIKHAEVLSDDEKYFNNNHGLMMDKSLMTLGHVLDEDKYFIKGYYRSIDTFWYSFSSKGTHLENSPEYHNMVVRMYDDLQEYLVNNGKTYGENVLGLLEIAKNYLDIIVKPDKRLPSIGDSGASPRKKRKLYNNFYDFEAGMAVMQYNGEKPYYVNFICGYSSKTHKHKDDLSININYNSEDFIIDPGKFNYNGKSPIRKYMISRQAHSSFQLAKYNYHIKRSNRFNRKIALDGYNFSKEVSIVKGFHKDYEDTDVALNRAVIQIVNQPITIIYDYVDNPSGQKLEYIQNFNLANHIEVKKLKDLFKLSGRKESLVIKQLLKTKNQEIILGDEKKPVAVNTVGFSKVKESSQIKYHNISEKSDIFLTAIYDESVIKQVKLLKLEDRIEIKIDRNIFTINI